MCSISDGNDNQPLYKSRAITDKEHQLPKMTDECCHPFQLQLLKKLKKNQNNSLVAAHLIRALFSRILPPRGTLGLIFAAKESGNVPF